MEKEGRNIPEISRQEKILTEFMVDSLLHRFRQKAVRVSVFMMMRLLVMKLLLVAYRWMMLVDLLLLR